MIAFVAASEGKVVAVCADPKHRLARRRACDHVGRGGAVSKGTRIPDRSPDIDIWHDEKTRLVAERSGPPFLAGVTAIVIRGGLIVPGDAIRAIFPG